MALTKRQKVMVTVLGLGAMALVVDKALLGEEQVGPPRAQAAQAVRAVVPPGPVGRPAEPPPAPGPVLGDSTVAEISALAAGLDTVRDVLALDLSDTRDAFCPSATWLSDLRPVESIVTSSQEARIIDFARGHKLKAVVTHGGGGAAFIDDKYVRVGQVIDGFRLVSVSDRGATLAAKGVQVELKLQTGPLDR